VFWIGVIRWALTHDGEGPEAAAEHVVEDADGSREVVESGSNVADEEDG
jgi:hypothetical protein